MRAVACVFLASSLASCGEGNDHDASPDESAPEFVVDFRVSTPGRFGALQLDIQHLGSSGEWVGRADKVDCVPLVEAIVASNYIGEDLLKVGMISLHGITTPAPIMRCIFRTRDDIGPSDFEIEVTDASGTDSTPIEPPPTVVVGFIGPR
jgi:hypothetical protein